MSFTEGCPIADLPMMKNQKTGEYEANVDALNAILVEPSRYHPDEPTYVVVPEKGHGYDNDYWDTSICYYRANLQLAGYNSVVANSTTWQTAGEIGKFTVDLVVKRTACVPIWIAICVGILFVLGLVTCLIYHFTCR